DYSRTFTKRRHWASPSKPHSITAAVALFRLGTVGFRFIDLSLLPHIWSLPPSLQEVKGKCEEPQSASRTDTEYQVEKGYFDEE
uniref:Uncharacterized protein n=1 Tax=Callorhinchus milii TaxID=7868 RepID=A0A4W3GRJ5_CALMI